MLSRPISSIWFCILSMVLATGASAAEPGRFVQKDFCISMWVAPPGEDNLLEYYRQMANANFTVVMHSHLSKNFDQQKRLDICEKLGLKAIMYIGAKGERPRLEGPACLGYQLMDEPNVKDFPMLAKTVADIRAKQPGKLAYINLFPDYANTKQLGTETYDEYVRRFIEEVSVDVLCFDYYPQMTPDTDGREGYCNNLDVIRRHALKVGIPFWNFFNIMPFKPHYDPTEAQVVWQIYTSLAYGAKGVLYFCYWTPHGLHFCKGGAIISGDGKPTRHYDQARRINAKLKRLGSTLMKLTSTKVVRIKPGENVPELLAGTPLKNLTDGDYLIGVFVHADGRQAVLLNNYRFDYTAWPTVEFTADTDKITEVDSQTGKEITLCDDSPSQEGLQISLDAAEGRLFLVNR